MKRKTAMALAAVFAMSVAGTALAAPANPFVDVPANHWAYGTVNRLAQAGVISGYGDGTYRGDRTMTRYEMAAIIARAMANSDKADAELQREIDALQDEFSAELYNLGVRVDNLESKMSNIKFTGEVRSRYESSDNALDDSNDKSRTRLRLFLESPVADNVTFHGRYQAESKWGEGSDSESKVDQAYITGNLGSVKYSFGRQPLWLGQGLLADIGGNNDGLILAGGKEVKVMAGVFKRDFDTYDKSKVSGSLDFYTANIDAKLGKDANLTISYLQDKDDEYYKTWSAGLNYRGIKNFTLSGEYGQNDADYANSYNSGDEAKGWFAKLKYKGANRMNPGSYGIWAGYRDAEKGFDPGEFTTLDGGRVDDATWAYSDNIKGAEFGFDYTVFKNGVFLAQYGDLEVKERNSGDKDRKNFFAQLRYWF